MRDRDGSSGAPETRERPAEAGGSRGPRYVRKYYVCFLLFVVIAMGGKNLKS